jgi:hypothetical protein
MGNAKEYLSSNEIVDVILEEKDNIYGYFYRLFHSINTDFQTFLIKKYSSYNLVREEVLQKAIYTMLEKAINLKKEAVLFTYFNYVKFALFNETRYSAAKEVYDFKVFKESGNNESFLEMQEDDTNPEIDFINNELNELLKSLIEGSFNRFSKKIGLTEEDKQILKLKYFNNKELSYNEMCEKFNISYNYLVRKLVHIKDKLREYYIINYYHLVEEFIPKRGKITDNRKNKKNNKNFSVYEDVVISKYFKKVEPFKILEILNFKRSNPVTFEDVSNRYYKIRKRP